MRYGIDLHTTAGDEITAGHRPGIIRIADASIYLHDALYENDVTQLQRLKEVIQVQINAIIAARGQAGRTFPSNGSRGEVCTCVGPHRIDNRECHYRALGALPVMDMEFPDPLPDPLPHVEVIEPYAAPVEEEKVIALDNAPDDIPF